MSLWTPTEQDWENIYTWCKKTDAWNSFTKNGVTPPSLTITSSQQSFLTSYRSSAIMHTYFQVLLLLQKKDPSFFDEEFDNALDDVRVSIWRNKDANGKPWKGIDTPGQNSYKLYYQSLSFQPIAWQRLLVTPPPLPEPELTNNEKKALKAFAGGLEATQEFVPDSWFTPVNQMEPQESLSEDINWKKQEIWRARSLSEVVTASRKALRTVLQRR